MKTTKIIIRNLFGISEQKLDGKSVEITGPKGSGKTSVLDSIRYALTNRSERDYIIRQGADEGEILIETDTGLSIDRMTRTTKADAVKVKSGNVMQTRPAEFLSSIFTPLQLNPVEFCQMPRQEKNRVILSLIEFDWDVNWIREKFGEIPTGIDYTKHILEVLADIQAENGAYFQSRQNINRDIRTKSAFVSDIAKDIPDGYQYDRWNNFPLGEKYGELDRIKENNSIIERAKAFRGSYDAKLRGIRGERDIALYAAAKEISAERELLTGSIQRLKAEIKAAEDKLSLLGKEKQRKEELVEANYQTALAKLEKDIGVATKHADMVPDDTTALTAEIETAEEMRKHLNEYTRMVTMQGEVEQMQAVSDELTRKIEIARELPSEILATATIPVDGLTVVDGVAMVNGLPVSNLSDGETLSLCVQIASAKPGQLGIILIDGCERLDDKSRMELYKQCKDAGLQVIATRTTSGDTLEVVEL